MFQKYGQSNHNLIYLIIANKPKQFLKTEDICTCISDCHEMAVAIFRQHMPKLEPREKVYRNYKKVNKLQFQTDLRKALVNEGNSLFLRVLNKHAAENAQ